LLLFNIIFVNAACARKNVLLNDVDVSHLVSAFKNIAKTLSPPILYKMTLTLVYKTTVNAIKNHAIFPNLKKSCHAFPI